MQERQPRRTPDTDPTADAGSESVAIDFDAEEEDFDAERLVDATDAETDLPDHLDAPLDAAIPDVIDQRREVPLNVETDGRR